MDPSTLAWINAGSKVLGSALQRPPQTSSAVSSASQFSTFDNSGWSVALGDGASASASGGLPPWVLAAGIATAALLGIVWIKRRA